MQGAHYILGPFGIDCDLRRWGLKMSERGGKNAKKRAVVAVARKLAVLLHHLWVTYQRCFSFDFLLRSSTPPAHPVFPSTFPGLPRVPLSHLAAPDLALSSASRLVHSAAKTCYASSRSISFYM